MASWGNQQGQQYPQDMDSSNGVTDQRLVVRNAAGTAGTDFRAAIVETGTSRNALKVDGKIRLVGGTNGARVAGNITPDTSDQDPTVNTLNINADTDTDPNTKIGFGNDINSAGNRVTIKGHHIGIGTLAGQTDDPDRIKLYGPTRNLGTLQVTNALAADTGLATPLVQARQNDQDLEIGTIGTSTVFIGAVNHTTEVQGDLTTDGEFSALSGALRVTTAGGVQITPNVQMSSNVLAGSLQADTVESFCSLTGTSLDINGDGDVSGALEVHGDLVVDGLVTSIQGDAFVTGSVQAGGPVSGSTLTTSGAADVGGDATVSGKTYHGNDVEMQDHSLYMSHLSPTSEVHLKAGTERLEIYVGGVLRFYVDSRGGHNA